MRRTRPKHPFPTLGTPRPSLPLNRPFTSETTTTTLCRFPEGSGLTLTFSFSRPVNPGTRAEPGLVTP